MKDVPVNINATRQTDLVSGLLAEYALGGLSKPTRVLVESHLELSDASEAWLSDVEQTRAIVTNNPEPNSAEAVELTNSSDMLESIFKQVDAASDEELSNTPRALEQFLGMPLADVPWSKVMPGLAEYRLPDSDGSEVSLLRIDGGKGMPVHTHHGAEITLVLKGGFSDGNGHYAVGDIAYADDDVNHKPVADPGEECICFAVVDAPVELTGPFGRLINSLRR